MFEIIHIPYFLKVNLAIILLYLPYLLVFRRSGHFLFNRIYLLSIPLIAFVAPAFVLEFKTINVQATASAFSASAHTESMMSFLIDPISIVPTVTNYWTWYDLLVIFYLSISSFLMIRLFIRIGNILVMKSKAHRISMMRPVFYLPGFSYNCSFFKWVFWHDSHTDPNDEPILFHEKIHGDQFHSLDILIIEVIRAILWINPVIHHLKKEVAKNHEFLADQGVLKKYNRKQYCNNLIKFSTLRNPSLAIPFASFTKTRIKMMNQYKPIKSTWIYFILLPFIALLNFSFTSPVFENIADQINRITSSDILTQLDISNGGHLIWGNLSLPMQRDHFSTNNKILDGVVRGAISKDEILRLQSDSMFVISELLTKTSITNTKFRQEYDNMDLDDNLRITTIIRTGYFGVLDPKIVKRIENSKDGDYLRIYAENESVSLIISMRINDEETMKDFVLWGEQKYGVDQINRISRKEFDNRKKDVPILYKDLIPQQSNARFVLANNRDVIECRDLDTCNLAGVNLLHMRFGKDYNTFQIGTIPFAPKTKYFKDLYEPIIQDNTTYVTKSTMYSRSGARIEIEEIPALFLWGDTKILLYYSSSKVKIFTSPVELTVSEAKHLFREIPKMYFGSGNSLTRLFANVKYIDGESVPEDFSVAYDLESKQIIQGANELREISEKLQPNDFLEFSLVRHQYSSEEGGQFRLRIVDKVSATYRTGNVSVSPYIPYERLKEIYPDYF